MSRPEQVIGGAAIWSGPITLAQSPEFLPQEPYAVLREDIATGAVDLSIAAGPKGRYDRATMACLANVPLNDDPRRGTDPERIAVVDRYNLGERLILDDLAVNALRRFWEYHYLTVSYTPGKPGDTFPGMFTVARGAEVGFRLDGFDYAVTGKGIVMGSLTAAARRHFYHLGLTETIEEQYAHRTW